MQIPFAAYSFPVGWFPTPHPKYLAVSWSDLVWAAITSGKAGSSYLLAHGWHSLADMVVRSHAIYANLRQGKIGCERSSLYDAQDPSEKGATSYFLGMTMAKLFAGEYFGTPWLFHLSYAKSLGVSLSVLPGSSSRPDLIGLTGAGEWIVMEAKGRTRDFSSSALCKAKSQTRMISSINGKSPVLGVALQAYFKASRLHVTLDDPPDRDRRAIDVAFDLMDAMKRYYAVAKAIAGLPTEDRVIGGRRYIVRFDPDSGITIGINRMLLASIDAGKLDELQASVREGSARPLPFKDEMTVYPDGISISLDGRWAPVKMREEPESR